MKRTISMAENHLFRRLYRIGKSSVTPHLVVYAKKTKLPYNRLGITVTKKIGNAVQRNRAKRLIKEAFRLMEEDLRESYDIVIVARSIAVRSNMWQVKKSLTKAFNALSIAMAK